MVQYTSDEHLTATALDALLAQHRHAFERHGIELVEWYLPIAGRSSIGVFAGTGADALRSALAPFGGQLSDTWPAQPIQRP